MDVAERTRLMGRVLDGAIEEAGLLLAALESARDAAGAGRRDEAVGGLVMAREALPAVEAALGAALVVGVGPRRAVT